VAPFFSTDVFWSFDFEPFRHSAVRAQILSLDFTVCVHEISPLLVAVLGHLYDFPSLFCFFVAKKLRIPHSTYAFLKPTPLRKVLSRVSRFFGPRGQLAAAHRRSCVPMMSSHKTPLGGGICFFQSFPGLVLVPKLSCWLAMMLLEAFPRRLSYGKNLPISRSGRAVEAMSCLVRFASLLRFSPPGYLTRVGFAI